MFNYILITLLSFNIFAQTNTGKTSSSRLNRNIYKQEEDPSKKNKSFTAKVKVIRQESNGVEVFFEGEKIRGAYLLLNSKKGYGKSLEALEKSRGPKGPPVSVTADPDQRIVEVSIQENKRSNEPEFGTLPDL